MFVASVTLHAVEKIALFLIRDIFSNRIKMAHFHVLCEMKAVPTILDPRQVPVDCMVRDRWTDSCVPSTQNADKFKSAGQKKPEFQ